MSSECRDAKVLPGFLICMGAQGQSLWFLDCPMEALIKIQDSVSADKLVCEANAPRFLSFSTGHGSQLTVGSSED